MNRKLISRIALGLFFVMATGSVEARRWRRYRRGGWGPAPVILGTGLGFTTGVLVGQAAKGDGRDDKARAEIEQLRRERENDRYQELKAEQVRQQLSQESKPLKKRKSPLERQLARLERRKDALLAQRNLIDERLQDERADNPEPDIPTKREIRLEKSLEKIEQTLQGLEDQIDELIAKIDR